jgi:hypothetical protein
LILTDSLSSLKALLSRKILHRTHPLVDECKQMCSDLLEDGVEIKIMWILAHVELECNEFVDEKVQFNVIKNKVMSSSKN